MTKRLLITRPNYDIATSYLHSFSKEIIKKVGNLDGFHQTDLEGDKANRKNFIEKLKKENPSLVFLNGHGDKNFVGGHKGEAILDSNNVSLTKDKIVYALACDSLKILGNIAIKEGTKVYIGYKEKFMFVKDPSRSSSPDKDRNALPFRKACFTLISSLIEGRSVNEAVEKTKKHYTELIINYGTSEDDPFGDIPLIRFALTWDLTYLDFYGDPAASFT